MSDAVSAASAPAPEPDDGLALGTPVRSATTKGLFRICGLWPHRVELVREGGGTRPFRVDRATFGLLYRVEAEAPKGGGK